MKATWETATEIPRIRGRGTYSRSTRRLQIEPGQIIRRPVINSTGGQYTSAFKRQGRTDLHVATRTVDGQRWLYIWRDPLPEAANGEEAAS